MLRFDSAYLCLQLGADLPVIVPVAGLQLLQLLVRALQLQVVPHQLPVQHGVGVQLLG